MVITPRLTKILFDTFPKGLRRFLSPFEKGGNQSVKTVDKECKEEVCRSELAGFLLRDQRSPE